MKYSIKYKLIGSYIVFVLITVLLSTLGAAYLTSHQIQTRNENRLVNAFSSIERQIFADISFLDKMAENIANNRYVRKELIGNIGQFGGKTRELIKAIRDVFSFQPLLKTYMVDLGMNWGLNNYAFYFTTDDQDNQQLLVQFSETLNSLIIGSKYTYSVNEQQQPENGKIKETAIFPMEYQAEVLLGIEFFEGKAGIFKKYPIVYHATGQGKSAHPDQSVIGNMILQKEFNKRYGFWG